MQAQGDGLEAISDRAADGRRVDDEPERRHDHVGLSGQCPRRGRETLSTPQARRISHSVAPGKWLRGGRFLSRVPRLSPAHKLRIQPCGAENPHVSQLISYNSQGMGGYGSGRSGRYLTTEQSCILDSAWLNKHARLGAGVIASGISQWRRGEEVAASISWAVDTTRPRDAHLRLRYRLVREHTAPEALEFEYPVVYSRPHLGGRRWWFVCYCGRRCAKLYFPLGASQFRCRGCYHLVYACQRESTVDRLLRRADKLRARLRPAKNGSRVLRPKWMRRRTYFRLREEAERLEAEGLAGMYWRLLSRLTG